MEKWGECTIATEKIDKHRLSKVIKVSINNGEVC